MAQEPETLRLGSYEILKKEDGSLWRLGKGVFGTTYKAKHRVLGSFAAVKVINDSLVQNLEARKRFFHEARSVAKLDHVNVARVFDADEQDDTFYFAMDYCEGGTLAELSGASGKLSWDEVTLLAQGIGRGLEHAHSLGMLHRDIKPTNIMLAKQDDLGSVKLIDFGLVKVLDENEVDATILHLTREGSFMGNALTASPEQVLEEDLDERSDLFSLGMTLWCLLAGNSPFEGQKTGKVLQKRLSQDSYVDDLPTDLSDHARTILAKLLEKNPDDRFSSVTEFLAALDDPGFGAEKIQLEEVDGEVLEIEEPEIIPLDGKGGRTISNVDVQEKIADVSSGGLYSALDKDSSESCCVLLLPKVHPETVERFLPVLESLPDCGLIGFQGMGECDGESVLVFDPILGESLGDLLASIPQPDFQGCLSVLRPVAETLDVASEVELPGVELRPELIWVSPGEDADGKEGYQCQLIPILIESDQSLDLDDTVTIGGQGFGTSLVSRFGALIYRMVSGMAVKQAAFHAKEAYIATSNLTEESNRLLRAVIAGESTGLDATGLLNRFSGLEGVIATEGQRGGILRFEPSDFPTQVIIERTSENSSRDKSEVPAKFPDLSDREPAIVAKGDSRELAISSSEPGKKSVSTFDRIALLIILIALTGVGVVMLVLV